MYRCDRQRILLLVKFHIWSKYIVKIASTPHDGKRLGSYILLSSESGTHSDDEKKLNEFSSTVFKRHLKIISDINYAAKTFQVLKVQVIAICFYY